MNDVPRLLVVDGMGRRPRLLVIGVVLAVLAAGGAWGWRALHGLPGDAAFKYSGNVVTKSALDERIKVLGALYGVERPTDSKKADTFLRAAAQADVMTLILDKAAADHDIVISDKKARDTLAQMMKSQLGNQPQRAFDQLLTKFGVSEDDILQEIKRQQSIALLFGQITKAATAAPSDADVAAYFRDHESQFDVPAKRHILNIVVANKAQADQVATAARTADFAGLARRYSLDDSTRGSGGDLGTVAAADLDDAYAKAAFGVPDGHVFGPVQTSHGWNVGKVVGIAAGNKVTLAKVKDSVVASMRSERALSAWHDWLAQQVEDAHVEYADAYRPADPDALPTIAGAGTDPTAGVR